MYTQSVDSFSVVGWMSEHLGQVGASWIVAAETDRAIVPGPFHLEGLVPKESRHDQQWKECGASSQRQR